MKTDECAVRVKRIEEEICWQRPEGSSVGRCGDLAVTQCASCTAFLCADHAHLCKNCRDHARHDKYCGNCINSHPCPGEIQAA